MNISSYKEAREYLELFIRPSIYAKVDSEEGIPHPLKRMHVLLELLGNPQQTFKSIQVSGTAGKGSTSYLLSHIVTTAGYKTGLTLSPHLQKLNERLQINGVPIADEAFISLVNSIVPIVGEMKNHELGEPSYFEILVALAFVHFAQQKVDIAIVEVGLEGRLDGTNTLHPLIGIITNIDLDHTEILGDTVEKIAQEAVSIIKKYEIGTESVIITGSKQEGVREIIKNRALEGDSKYLLLEQDFSYTTKEVTKSGSIFDFTSPSASYKNLQISLLGSYQIENAVIAIEAILELASFGFTVTEANLRLALSTASFSGRFEILSSLPSFRATVILDGAHNPSKMHAFLQALQELYPHQKKIFIVTFKKDKDVSSMLKEIELQADILILTEFHRTIDTAKNASITVQELSSQQDKSAGKRQPEVFITDSAEEALHLAQEKATEDDLVIITGSLYLIGEIKEHLSD